MRVYMRIQAILWSLFASLKRMVTAAGASPQQQQSSGGSALSPAASAGGSGGGINAFLSSLGRRGSGSSGAAGAGGGGASSSSPLLLERKTSQDLALQAAASAEEADMPLPKDDIGATLASFIDKVGSYRACAVGFFKATVALWLHTACALLCCSASTPPLCPKKTDRSRCCARMILSSSHFLLAFFSLQPSLSGCMHACMRMQAEQLAKANQHYLTMASVALKFSAALRWLADAVCVYLFSFVMTSAVVALFQSKVA